MAEEGIAVTLVGHERRPGLIVNQSASWHAPVLFIAWGLASGEATTVSVALNVLSTYIADFLKGAGGAPQVKVEVVVEREADRVCKRLIYEGDAEGLAALEPTIRRIASGK
ncbi:MAG: hypothetical protein EON96_00805 [Caulobacteraceae bacterium]|nr:MAG: hypothetical protein EON96_00805 [Caulobacteraceae bacterium]